MASSIFLTSSLFFLSSFSIIMHVNCDCSFSKCTTSSPRSYFYSRDPIPFPFSTPDQSRGCGLPGFELGCNVSNATPLLSFPNGDVFTVEYISSYSREIEVSNFCLLEKLMHFNSTGTPFHAKGFTEFAFFTCPSFVQLIDIPLSYMCGEIKCVRTIVCELSVNSSNFLDHGCDFVGNINVAGIWYSALEFIISNSIYLTWEKPRECEQCDSRKEVCGGHSHNYTNFKCVPQVEDSEKGISTTKLLLIILPILALITTCVLYLRHKQLQNENRNASTPTLPTHVNIGSHTSQGSNATQGLKQATLDAYPIVQVGDSGRVLINMEEKGCAICLSDYEPKDVIKSLPECLHRFHSDCIDEWLRAKAICPICQTTPPQTSS